MATLLRNDQTGAAEVGSKLRHLWPSSRSLDEEGVFVYLDELGEFPTETVLKALRYISDEGDSRRPNPGQVRARCRAMRPNARDNEVGCLCWKVPLEHCPAKHSDAWVERQKIRERALATVGGNLSRGIPVDPSHFSGYEGVAIEAVLLQRFYDANRAAGRAIDDAGVVEAEPEPDPVRGPDMAIPAGDR